MFVNADSYWTREATCGCCALLCMEQLRNENVVDEDHRIAALNAQRCTIYGPLGPQHVHLQPQVFSDINVFLHGKVANYAQIIHK